MNPVNDLIVKNTGRDYFPNVKVAICGLMSYIF